MVLTPEVYVDLWLDVAHQVNEGVDDLLLVGGHGGLHPINLLLGVHLDAVGNVALKERGEFFSHTVVNVKGG